jgi:hypothetical protein
MAVAWERKHIWPVWSQIINMPIVSSEPVEQALAHLSSIIDKYDSTIIPARMAISMWGARLPEFELAIIHKYSVPVIDTQTDRKLLRKPSQRRPIDHWSRAVSEGAAAACKATLTCE